MYVNVGEPSTKAESTIPPGDTPPNKSDSAFLGNSQAPITPLLKLGVHELLPNPCCNVDCNVQCICHVQKTTKSILLYNSYEL